MRRPLISILTLALSVFTFKFLRQLMQTDIVPKTIHECASIIIGLPEDVKEYLLRTSLFYANKQVFIIILCCILKSFTMQ